MKTIIILILLSLVACAHKVEKDDDKRMKHCRLGDDKQYYCGNDTERTYAKPNIFDEGSRFIQGVRLEE